jgi:SNF2 family DNA or RNA helicase
MDEDKAKQRLLAESREGPSAKGKTLPKSNARAQHRRGTKRTRIESDDSSDEEGHSKRLKGENGGALRVGDEDESSIFQQPALITGAQLKPYQLEGLQWMVSLDTNGISGILGISFLIVTNENAQEYHIAADEMGLGKVLILSLASNCTEGLNKLRLDPPDDRFLRSSERKQKFQTLSSRLPTKCPAQLGGRVRQVRPLGMHFFFV